jgi:pimeloyl-ACP methyl ester carboxylesterase
VSGQDDLRALRERVPPEVREMVDRVAADPAGFENAAAGWAGPELLWDLTVTHSAPVDIAVYTEPAFASAYRTALAEGFAQGPAGYARDLVLALGPWPTTPEQVRVPVDLWYGELDASPVHSPDHGRTLATRFPGARLHLCPDEGGSLLWTRAAEILDGLARA